VREFVAEFTSQNWEETKKAAYDSGVKEKKTGIAKQFEAMEKAEAKINAKNPKERLKAVQACEEIFKLLGGLTPEWISPRSDNAAPEGFITYIQDMRNLASEKRLELLGAIPQDELKTRPYFLADIAATPKSFSDNCEIAKRYGVVMDDAVKAASKAFEEFQKLRQKMPDDLEEFDGDEFDAKLALQMIETSRDLSIAVAACAPANKLTGDVDQSFRAYADTLSTHILQHITEPLESFADGKRAQFSPPAHRDDSPKLSRHRVKEAYETARNECLLEEEMPESMTAALDKLSAALKREELNLADDELDGSAKLIKAFDEIAVDLLEFEKEARSWRKQIRDHKPFRDYLLELAESARAKAKEADAKKAICVAARDGAEKVGDAPKRPTLSLGDWTRWVTVARAQPGKIDRGNAAGTTQAFKNYEKAPLLPPADELLEDVKHARKIFKKRRHALYSLDALLPKVMKVDDPELGSAIKSWLETVRLDYADIDYAEGVVDGFEMEAKRERDEEKAARKAARRK